MSISVFSLPEFRIGPYELQVVAADRCNFADKRRRAEADWTRGIIRIDATSTPLQALTSLVKYILTAIHYRSGLNDASDEESYTHSLSSGLVELARSYPLFWEGFISVLEQTLRPNSGWLLAAGGLLPGEISKVPKTITHRGFGCKIITLSDKTCNKQRVYGYYCAKRAEIELSDGLQGANLAVVSLHEVTHFLHDCEGLTKKHTEKQFKDRQLQMLLKFWKNNPKFWRWWLSMVNPLNQVERPLLMAA